MKMNIVKIMIKRMYLFLKREETRGRKLSYLIKQEIHINQKVE